MTADITPIVAKGFKLIEGYGEGFYRIEKEKREGHLLIYTTEVHPIDIEDFSNLTIDDFNKVFSLIEAPELILVGTGKKLHMIPPTLRALVKDKGQGTSLELMDSAAACRTYNALVAEGRKVAALLACI